MVWEENAYSSGTKQVLLSPIVRTRVLGRIVKKTMLRKYRVGYTQDQLRYTPACALDSKVPVRVVREILTRNADEVCQDGKLKYGQSRVVISEQGIIEIEEESSQDTSRVLSLLKGKVEVRGV
jgi:hypothetical protein